MVDRSTIYFGQVPLETDLLRAEQNAMVALAKLAVGTISGTNTAVNGFTCTPTGPASLNVIVTAGEIYQFENLEQSNWSSLTADTHTILKQGILLDPLTFGITPPGTVGFSQNFLIEVQYQDLDTGLVVLPYFNAANPSSPFSGPGNAGTSQNTVRKGVAALQVKAGIAASTGTQTTPTADAGWTGLFVVTVANGATTITSGNITQLTSAPFIQSGAKLLALPTSIQNSIWTYAVDSGTVNSLVVTLTPPVMSYQAGLSLIVKIANTNIASCVINVNGLGNQTIVHRDGSAMGYGELTVGALAGLVFDGTNFQLAWTSAPPNALIPLSAPATLYVNGSTGSDTLYDGTQATVSGTHGPFATIGKALTIMTRYDLSGFNFTINVADGTYSISSPISFPPPNGVGTVFLTGNHATPANVFVQNNVAGSAFVANRGGNYFVDGFTLSAVAALGGDAGNGIAVGGPTNVTIVALRFGACIGSHMETGPGGFTLVEGPITINGNAFAHQSSYSNGSLLNDNFTPPNLTISIPVSITFFASAQDGAQLRPVYGTITGAGNVTGTRYFSQSKGVIDTQGGGATYLPGTVAGATQTGGQYV
jgi:hypothetical protein